MNILNRWAGGGRGGRFSAPKKIYIIDNIKGNSINNYELFKVYNFC